MNITGRIKTNQIVIARRASQRKRTGTIVAIYAAVMALAVLGWALGL